MHMYLNAFEIAGLILLGVGAFNRTTWMIITGIVLVVFG